MPLCHECRQPFESVKPFARFCQGKGCQKTHHNRRMLEGAKIRELALYWRQSRKKEALTELCSALDSILARERQDGRPRRTRPQIVNSRVYIALGTDRMPRQTFLQKLVAK